MKADFVERKLFERRAVQSAREWRAQRLGGALNLRAPREMGAALEALDNTSPRPAAGIARDCRATDAGG